MHVTRLPKEERLMGTGDDTRGFNVAEELLKENARLRGEKVAIYCGGEEVTYAELLRNVKKFANVLKGLGVKPEDRVMIHLPDSPMFFYSFLGSIWHGAWPVPVNTMLEEEDYHYLLDNSEAAVLVTTGESKAAKVRSSRFCYSLYADNGLNELLGYSLDEADVYHACEEDIAFWLYSSGSTGRPKAVPHRHVDMIHTADTYGKQVVGILESDILFSVSKLFFAYGLGNGLSFPLRAGASTVLLKSPPSPESVMETVCVYRPTVFFGVPTQYNSVLKRMENSSIFSSVRVCTSAGEALPPEIYNRWKERTGLEILDGIGSTEALHIFISNTAGDQRQGCSGRVVPGYEARIVDDMGGEVRESEAGHLVIRGRSITPGYWMRPEENEEKFLPQGWFKTGDMYAQEDGYFTYQGRGDDMLKVGGIWVSPVEIENVLLEHHAVHEAAVVGHDVEGLSKPFGYIALNEEYREGSREDDGLAEDLIQFVSDRLPKFKWLRGVYFVDDLPKTATGKIQRFKLRRLA
jgi:benzoate-CoA ligase family protein